MEGLPRVVTADSRRKTQKLLRLGHTQGHSGSRGGGFQLSSFLKHARCWGGDQGVALQNSSPDV